MSTSVDFNDGAAASLTNGRPVPADRFWGWTPIPVDVADVQVTLGPGDTESFIYRTDDCVKFELRNIPESMLPVAYRLKRHLERGGSCTVNTGDPTPHSYTAKIRPKGEITIEEQDANRRHFVMRFELKNTAAGIMECNYASA